MSRVISKPTFSMYKNEDVDQLHRNRATFRSASLGFSLQRGSVPELAMLDPIIRKRRSRKESRARMEKTINLILVTKIHQQARASQ